MFGSIFSIGVAILLFGFIVFFHELGHFLVAKKAGVLVHEFSIGMGPVIVQKEKGDTVYSLRLLPIGGFVALESEMGESDDPRSLTAQNPLTQIGVFVAGAVMNLILGYLLLLILLFMSGVVGTTMLTEVEEGTAAYGSLQHYDEIVRINGSKVYTSNDITQEFLSDRDGLITFDIRRDGEIIKDIPVQFNMTELEDGVMAIDMDFYVYGRYAEFSDYITYPVNWGLSIVKQVWGSLIDLVTGRYTVNQLSGPVGVTSVIVEATKMGIEPLLYLAAMITINIGIFNLLPLPILDGGRILFIFIEMIIGKKIKREVLEKITVGSVILLMGLMAYVTVNDLFKLFMA